MQRLLFTPDDIARPPHVGLHIFPSFDSVLYEASMQDPRSTLKIVRRFGLQWLLFTPDDIARPPQVVRYIFPTVDAVFYEAPMQDSRSTLVLPSPGDLRFGLQCLLSTPDDIARPPQVVRSISPTCANRTPKAKGSLSPFN